MHRPALALSLTVALAAFVSAAPVTLGSLPNASAAKQLHEGPDVASYQHPQGKPIHWKKVAKSGKDFAIVKATEGTTYRNPNFAGPAYDDYADAAKAGLVHGAYHFARPGFPIVSNANAQAKYFVGVVGPVRTKATLPPALDLEETGGLNPAQLVTWAQAFELKVRNLTGRTPILYTYPNFWTDALGDPKALARYPLWMAQYTSNAPAADLWQYTSTARVPGIEGDTDVSKFIGTTGLPWSTLSDGTIRTPWKAAAPAAPVSVAASIDGTTSTISWKPGDSGTARITKYTVTALANGVPVKGANSHVSVSGSTFVATLSNLNAGTAYSFTVTASNSVGKGAPSVPSDTVTPTILTKLKASIPASLAFGDSLKVTAKLVRKDTKAGLSGQPVLVYRRHTSNGAWHQIEKLSTNDNGRASVELTPHKSARLEAVFPGQKGVSRSAIYKSYVVHPAVTGSLSAKRVKVGGTAVISGTVAPYKPGQLVSRQRLVNGKWVTKDTTTVSDDGQYSFTMTPSKSGTYVFRTVVAKSEFRGLGKTTRLTLTVS